MYRGLRLIELLKQTQSNPLQVEKQIILIYAGMKGYLDSIAIDKVENYKQFLLSAIDYSNILVHFDKNQEIPTKTFESFFNLVSNSYKSKN